MYTVEQALALILQDISPLPAETLDLSRCLGRVLARDVYADVSQPPFDNSAVDGYAVRAADTAGASEQSPVLLDCIGDIPAGAWPSLNVGRGECARIMTGAPVPDGADAIVMREDAVQDGAGRIAIRQEVRTEGHIRRRGEDGRAGDLALPAGTRLGAAQIGVLAQMGQAHVAVIRLPRVAVISTGDEVVEVQNGVIPRLGEIRDSNRYALAALVQETGAQVHSRTHIPDDLAATQDALRQCAGLTTGGQTEAADVNAKQDANQHQSEDLGESEDLILEDLIEAADVIVTAGGVSVGERDFVKAALESLGTLQLWRVAMKPGKPLAFGRIGKTLFFGLPGNPVSAQVTFELFVRPALLQMAGWRSEDIARRQVEAALTEAIAHVPGRREYMRAVTRWESGRFVARVCGAQSSADARSLALANSLLIVPEAVETIAAGERVSVLLLD